MRVLTPRRVAASRAFRGGWWGRTVMTERSVPTSHEMQRRQERLQAWLTTPHGVEPMQGDQEGECTTWDSATCAEVVAGLGKPAASRRGRPAAVLSVRPSQSAAAIQWIDRGVVRTTKRWGGWSQARRACDNCSSFEVPRRSRRFVRLKFACAGINCPCDNYISTRRVATRF